MTVLIVPLAGLTATPIIIWTVAALAERRHTRNHDHDRELAAINQWLTAIRATQ